MVSEHTIHSINVTASMAASHLMVSVTFIVFKPCSVSVCTEDAYTTQDQVCECLSCAILIKAGEPCFISIVPSHYSQSSYNSAIGECTKNYSRSSYNLTIGECCTKKIINPPPVVAVSDWTNTSMGPPPMSHRPHLTSSPDVNIPTSWGSRGPIGYSLHHGIYAAERQQ
ncbi:hypothetical protein C8R48DRAFT_780345 [Suillus tomentosus]|nr:hypothetical protein C8R48DRAFT_780345 [Suillus tomentosus]